MRRRGRSRPATPRPEPQSRARARSRVSSGASVVVVGGGATGLSVAWWLARDGVDVLVVEAGVVGAEASGRNGGGCSHHFSPLFAEEQRLWPLMDELLGYPTEFQPNRIRIAFDPHQMEIYGRAMANGARYGFRSEVLDAQGVLDCVPLAGGDIVGGYFFHFGGHANPHRTVQAYAWALEDLGGRLMQRTRVLGFRCEGGRVVAVQTGSGEFGCDSLVLAAGPATGRLAAMLGIDVPMVSARAEMIVT